jgi:hypothetical protein
VLHQAEVQRAETRHKLHDYIGPQAKIFIEHITPSISSPPQGTPSSDVMRVNVIQKVLGPIFRGDSNNDK